MILGKINHAYARPSLIERIAQNPDGPRLSGLMLCPSDNGVNWNEWQHPLALHDRSSAALCHAVEKGLSRASDADRSMINAALGFRQTKSLPHRAICSHAGVRQHAMETLYVTTKQAWTGPPDTRRQWMLFTAITDLGNSVEDRPTIEMHRLERQVRKVVSELGLNAVMILETQAAVRYPGGGLGGTLMTHVHGIAYTDDPNFNLRKAQATACKRSILSNWLGAPTVRMKEIKTKSDLYRACYYINKHPHRASRLVRDSSKRSGYRTVHQAVEAGPALRLAELLSQLEYKDVVFATHGGVRLKGDWMRALHVAHRSRAASFDDDFSAMWDGFWQARSGGRRRLPFDLRWSTSQAVSNVWEDAMQEWKNRQANKH